MTAVDGNFAVLIFTSSRVEGERFCEIERYPTVEGILLSDHVSNPSGNVLIYMQYGEIILWFLLVY